MEMDLSDETRYGPEGVKMTRSGDSLAFELFENWNWYTDADFGMFTEQIVGTVHKEISHALENDPPRAKTVAHSNDRFMIYVAWPVGKDLVDSPTWEINFGDLIDAEIEDYRDHDDPETIQWFMDMTIQHLQRALDRCMEARHGDTRRVSPKYCSEDELREAQVVRDKFLGQVKALYSEVVAKDLMHVQQDEINMDIRKALYNPEFYYFPKENEPDAQT